ncbi:N-acetylmuramoyl-L-alanine amidase [Actinokineospora sp. G85]|uniref:N-acetylmuramoyl-L-alanine amidase n=1 Tax=Actinokineospora sp. G85 TaxID=3406626 RepID=UPI003C794F65
MTAVALTVAGAAVPSASAAPPPPGRQGDFAAAAAEFGVPEPVLLAVSYLQSRWDSHAGQPSTAAGYGPMHLTDVVTANQDAPHHSDGAEDPRGDSARLPLAPAHHPADTSAASLRTVERAAELTGLDPAALRSDPAANIRGGAALLADHQRALGARSTDPARWHAAVARYSGATDPATATAFADEVFSVLRTGMARTTDDGQRVTLPATDVPPAASAQPAGVECPPGLGCESIPAPYEEFDGTYGNHDKADRPRGQKVEYIVIHDTEATWDTTLDLVQDPTYVSWHYSLRSSDGHIAQHLPTKDVGWHAGNWYVNAKSIGLEHEGFAARGTWFTEAMYRSSAKLVRHLAAKHKIPLDRQHVIGHDNVPGTTPATVAGMHWDPGPFYDWAHYFDLLGAPLEAQGHGRDVVMVRPDFATNRPAFTGCLADGSCPSLPSSSVILRSAPSDTAPLLADPGLRPDGSPSTMGVSDIGSRVDTGQRYTVAERRGGWTAVWYLGQKGWLKSEDVVPAKAARVVARGAAPVPVYGRAYPEAAAYPPGITPQSVVPLQYSLPPGQSYTVGWAGQSEYYWATTFDPSTHVVVRGEPYLQIQYGHRVAFVRAADVRLVR